jgi:hypothetical protein
MRITGFSITLLALCMAMWLPSAGVETYQPFNAPAHKIAKPIAAGHAGTALPSIPELHPFASTPRHLPKQAMTGLHIGQRHLASVKSLPASKTSFPVPANLVVQRSVPRVVPVMKPGHKGTVLSLPRLQTAHLLQAGTSKSKGHTLNSLASHLTSIMRKE